MQVETLQSDLQALKRENKALKASLKECKDQRAVIEAVSKVEMKLTGEGQIGDKDIEVLRSIFGQNEDLIKKIETKYGQAN